MKKAKKRPALTLKGILAAIDGVDRHHLHQRLEFFAASALTGLIADGLSEAAIVPQKAAACAWDFAEALELERARRLA